MDPMHPKYKRVLLKISGEALAVKGNLGINDQVLMETAAQVKQLHDLGIQIGIVCGGGNFWRGRTSGDMDRASADYMGMLATVMNAIGLADALHRLGVPAKAFSAVGANKVAEPFTIRAARQALEEGTVAIFGGGVGDPFFTTDTATALRACEIEAEVILMGKSIDYVYDSDPAKNPDAKPYRHLTHEEVLAKQLGVMDATAAALCRDNHIAIHMFGLADPANVLKAACGEDVGTIIE